jgi:hypothetical protein
MGGVFKNLYYYRLSRFDEEQKKGREKERKGIIQQRKEKRGIKKECQHITMTS